jgi:hypothetical protein
MTRRKKPVFDILEGVATTIPNFTSLLDEFRNPQILPEEFTGTLLDGTLLALPEDPLSRAVILCGLRRRGEIQ